MNPTDSIIVAALRMVDSGACQEFKFHPTRRWKADFACPTLKILIEKDGGVFTKGAHGSVSGILRDMEKYTEAAKLGYAVLRYLPGRIGECIGDVETLIKNRGKK